MTETKVYKLHESKQVEDITTMLKIEGLKHNVFEYEELHSNRSDWHTIRDNKSLHDIPTGYNH